MAEVHRHLGIFSVPEEMEDLVTSANCLSALEREVFVHVVQESLAITTRCQLLLWLQGGLQRLLPHDALVLISENRTAGRVDTEVICPPAAVGASGCINCHCSLISRRLLERWQHARRQMISFYGAVDGVVSEACDCGVGTLLRSMSSVLAHGLRDERTGEEVLYVLFAADTGDERHRAMLALLLPQIDFACRRAMTAAPFEQAGENRVASAFVPGRVSVREQEILGWVRAGKTNYEIGQILNISAFTVKNHLQRIYRKIDVMNRAQAVAKLDEYARGR